MKSDLSRSLGAILLVPLAAALGGGGAADGDLVFERSDTLALSIAHVEVHALGLEHLGVRRGEDTEQVAALQLALGTTLEAAVVDEPREDGRGLRRAFDAAAGLLTIGPPGEDGQIAAAPVELTSPLVGTSVAFLPRADQPLGWARHFDSVREAEESELPRLEPPTDWGLLLPPEDAAAGTGTRVGDAWDLAPEALRAVLAPVGHLALEAADEEALDARMLQAIGNGVGANLQVGFGGDVAGTARAEVVEIEAGALDGDVAVIRIPFELDFVVDRTAVLAEGYVPAPGESAEGLLSAMLELSLEGTATVRWSFALARPLSASVAADELVEFVTGTIDAEGQIVVQTLRFRGKVSTRTTLGDAVLTRDR